AGLSSSAALEVAVALALGFDGSPVALAELTQRAEQRASGVPCGIMDQLASAAGVADHAVLIDCHRLTVRPVPMPRGLEVRVIHSGEPRELAGSAYADRKAELGAAEAVVGPLRLLDDVARLDVIADDVVRRRARHVVTENGRVRAAVAALSDGDGATLGRLLGESHRSLRDDLEVSTPALDALVDGLAATPGVHGARLTGAGFGGCAMAVCEPGALDIGWRVHPARGARRLD
ncbi:MAG: galactokinase, partial [Acidimicrobiales bacterium]|nr:galactokinase [Acidimicrobiales bacterium]